MNPAVPYESAYWVEPGRFLAGRYPANRLMEEQTRLILDRMLEGGLRVFINLTRPEELPPYEELLRREAGIYGVEVECEQMSIHDFGVPTVHSMAAILDRIDRARDEGKPVYVHCWGGIGRTGTVVGCWLVRHGMSGEQALEHIRQLRSPLPDGKVTASPETDEQRKLILGWKIGA